MSDFYRSYERNLYKNYCCDGKYKREYKDEKCKKGCPTVVVLTFSIVDSNIAEINVAGPLTCAIPPEGTPVAPFIQCLILEGFEIIAFTQGGLDNNFITYTFVDC